jgi:hypothetical protein
MMLEDRDLALTDTRDFELAAYAFGNLDARGRRSQGNASPWRWRIYI